MVAAGSPCLLCQEVDLSNIARFLVKRIQNKDTLGVILCTCNICRHSLKTLWQVLLPLLHHTISCEFLGVPRQLTTNIVNLRVLPEFFELHRLRR